MRKEKVEPGSVPLDYQKITEEIREYFRVGITEAVHNLLDGRTKRIPRTLKEIIHGIDPNNPQDKDLDKIERENITLDKWNEL